MWHFVPTGSGIAFISQVPDFVSEMDLFWYVQQMRQHAQQLSERERKWHTAESGPSKADCVMDGGLYFTARKDSSISSLTFPPHAWRVSARYDQKQRLQLLCGHCVFQRWARKLEEYLRILPNASLVFHNAPILFTKM